jgi:flagellar hook-associated protein 3 FlgL
MRVTDQQLYSTASTRIMDARSEAAISGDQVSTGVAVVHPWDDPAAAGMIARHAADQARQDAVLGTATRASSELVAVDGTMDQVTLALTRAHELAVQLASDTYNASDRANAAAEVQHLQQAMIAQLNQRVGDRYVFGGTADGAPPFNAAGAYLGDAGVRQVEVAPGVMQDASIRADQAFKGAGGGVDVVTAVGDLATALASNNAVQIRAAVQSLGDGLQQVTSFRSRVGAMMSVFDVAAGTARSFRDGAMDAGSKLQAVDIFQASTRFAAAQQSLQASMSAATQQFKLTLLDKL